MLFFWQNLTSSSLKEPDDAANTYVDAFKVYKQESPEDAVRCLDFSIQQYCKKGNFRRAAQHKENLAEVLETQIGDIKRALEAYELAAGWYESDNAAAYVKPSTYPSQVARYICRL